MSSFPHDYLSLFMHIL